MIYLITKFGYIHVLDLMTAQLVYMNRISAETIFVTTPSVSDGGIMGINKKGTLKKLEEINKLKTL